MIDAQTNNMRKMLATDLEHLQLALNVIECLSETLEQYQQAMEHMTNSRNNWKLRYYCFCAPARTREEASTCSDI